MLDQAFNKGADTQAALVYGHKNTKWDVIDAAIKAGADINASVDGSANGDTFLIAAIKESYFSKVSQYLDRGADPNITFGEKSAIELVLQEIKKRLKDNQSVDTVKKVSERMLAVLPEKGAAAAQEQTDMTVKKEVVLKAPTVLKATGGVLGKYVRLVKSASEGCVTD